jgi:hypothetical protein
MSLVDLSLSFHLNINKIYIQKQKQPRSVAAPCFLAAFAVTYDTVHHTAVAAVLYKCEIVVLGKAPKKYTSKRQLFNLTFGVYFTSYLLFFLEITLFSLSSIRGLTSYINYFFNSIFRKIVLCS